MNVLVASFLFLFLYCGNKASENGGKQKKSYDIHHKMTDFELKRYFGVSSLSNVPEYDVAFPKHADERGQHISSHRAKRGIEETGLKFYHLKAFDQDLHLNVTLNKRLLGPGFYVETRHKDGSQTINDALHRNFYHGHVVGHPRSSVALSDNNGVSGAIRLVDDEMLYMEPVPRHLLDNDHDNENVPHLVVKKAEKDLQKEHKVMFETEEIPQRDEPVSVAESESYSEDDENGHKFYEVVYVGDHLITEQIGLIELPDMLLIIANIVSRMYTDSSFGEIKLHYVVTKMVILNNGELTYNRNASNGNKLDEFGRWIQKTNPESDSDPLHVDAGTLFTSYTGGGLALSGGMCYWKSMPSVVGAIGLSSSAIAAHENFHNLGGGHDGGTPECPNGANIMSTYVPSGKACFTWSNCSRRFIQNYLRSGRSFCLRDAPTIKPPAIPPYIKHNLPGVIFDGNKQCQYVLGTPAARQCSATCGFIFCDSGGGCWSSGGSPAEGTACGENKWCIRGECVDNGRRPPRVNGNWGSWSEFSECSRTCGVGVKYRSRKCDSPRPQRGGKPCQPSGEDLEERTTCNTHPCPSNSQPFREMQCNSISVNFTSYIRRGAECYLWCLRRGEGWATLNGQVKDGTRCYKDSDDENDICVRGECERIGCDKKLNGNELDRCAVCGGDGSTCEPRITNYTKIYERYGFDNADDMIILRKGYSKVHARMIAKHYNMIGVQNMDGDYLIKLPTWTTTQVVAGMKITYIHRSNQYQDEIIIPGRITQDIKLVFVYFRGRNKGVVIRYNVPVESPVKPSSDMFYWKTDEWSTCSKTCAGGFSTRDVKCFRKDDNTRVGNSNCPKDKKPATKQKCNVQHCPAEWHSYVTPCSRTCGKGTQSRKIECRRLTSNDWRVVDDSECIHDARPTGEPDTHCNKLACPPVYITGPWSECSRTCDVGTMTRTLKCQMMNDQGGITVLPMSICEHYKVIKPATKMKCNFDKTCVAKPKYRSLGCFTDRHSNRTLPRFLKNLRLQINWHNITPVVEACALLAQQHNVQYFAVQYYGECWAADPGTVPHYDKYGASSNCWNGVGGAWTNHVYRIVKSLVN